jgi:putative ABC transport system substrate-binding protein
MLGVEEGLRQLGYVEDKNIVFEKRWAQGKVRPVAHAGCGARGSQGPGHRRLRNQGHAGAKKATSTVPIVMASAGDIVALGVVQNLAKPGGNVTGSINVGRELGAKRLSLLKEAVPKLEQVAYLVNPANPAFTPNLEAVRQAAPALKAGRATDRDRRPERDRRRGRPGGAQPRRVAAAGRDDVLRVRQVDREHAVARRVPSAGGSEFPESGGLIGYGPDYQMLDRRAAYFVDRILKGAKPADLPVEQPTKFDLRVNLRTAKAIGVAIPQSIRAVADKAIQ